ncbi:unnamed protein product, partial [Symbiodinium pilosum]
TDDERPRLAAAVPLRAIGAALGLGLILGAAATALASRSHGIDGSSLEFVGLADDTFEIPHLTLPPSPVDEAKDKAAEFRDKWGINNIRHDQITLCVTNLNLGLWKLIQWAAVMGETVENCPGGFTNIDKKIACNINIAALVASMSAAISFFASTAFLCTGKDNPEPLELLFCSWQIAQTVWFFVRAGPLIEIATKVCPAPPGGQAACSEVVNEVMLMFFNAAKFIAAASTNCIDGIDVRAGCALGSLNLISGIA